MIIAKKLWHGWSLLLKSHLKLHNFSIVCLFSWKSSKLRYTHASHFASSVTCSVWWKHIKNIYIYAVVKLLQVMLSFQKVLLSDQQNQGVFAVILPSHSTKKKKFNYLITKSDYLPYKTKLSEYKVSLFVSIFFSFYLFRRSHLTNVFRWMLKESQF